MGVRILVTGGVLDPQTASDLVDAATAELASRGLAR
jgi:hypothetical protein